LVVFDYGIHHTPKPTIRVVFLFRFRFLTVTGASVVFLFWDLLPNMNDAALTYHRFPVFVFSFFFFSCCCTLSFIFSEAGSRHLCWPKLRSLLLVWRFGQIQSS
jgi:hypothetical protein